MGESIERLLYLVFRGLFAAWVSHAPEGTPQKIWFYTWSISVAFLGLAIIVSLVELSKVLFAHPKCVGSYLASKLNGRQGVAVASVILIVGIVGYLSVYSRPISEPLPMGRSPVRASASDSVLVGKPKALRVPVDSFERSQCREDCSGHRAGYKWAENHAIDSEDDCDAAGNNSNSPSFAEGCKSYVNGDDE